MGSKIRKIGMFKNIACSGHDLNTVQGAEALLKEAFGKVHLEQRKKSPLSLRFPVNPLAKICETEMGSANKVVTSKDVDSNTSEVRMLGLAADTRRNAYNDGRAHIACTMKGVLRARWVDKCFRAEGSVWSAERALHTVHFDNSVLFSRVQAPISQAALRSPIRPQWANAVGSACLNTGAVIANINQFHPSEGKGSQ